MCVAVLCQVASISTLTHEVSAETAWDAHSFQARTVLDPLPVSRPGVVRPWNVAVPTSNVPD